jgi:UDPglucose 6-dehydrogenase
MADPKRLMKIAVAGYGVLGKVHVELLQPHFDIMIYDPLIGYKTKLKQCDGLIICLPTPTIDGVCNIDHFIPVIKKAPNVPILVRSTISIEGWRKLQDEFPKHSFTFSPEFLREANAEEDFKNIQYMVMGGGSTHFWSDIFHQGYNKLINIIQQEAEELILTKYLRNSFLATKVAFFNQAYELCESLGVDFEKVALGVGNDSRIGHSHMSITPERGYGGKCLPKDVKAIIGTAEHHNVKLSIIEEVDSYNESIRDENFNNRS